MTNDYSSTPRPADIGQREHQNHPSKKPCDHCLKQKHHLPQRQENHQAAHNPGCGCLRKLEEIS